MVLALVLSLTAAHPGLPLQEKLAELAIDADVPDPNDDTPFESVEALANDALIAVAYPIVAQRVGDALPNECPALVLPTRLRQHAIRCAFALAYFKPAEVRANVTGRWLYEHRLRVWMRRVVADTA